MTRNKRGGVLGALLLLAIFVTGAVLVYFGVFVARTPVPAPLAVEATFAPGDPIIGSTSSPSLVKKGEEKPLAPLNGKVIGEVSIPAANTDTMVEATKNMEWSQGSKTIEIPEETYSVLWSPGAPLTGGDKGTTLVAGHVTYNGSDGALVNLNQTRPGMLLWSRSVENEGKWERWIVTEVFNRPRAAFPEEWWSPNGPEGERRMILVTCGGSIDSAGHYSDNVFVVARPYS